MICLPHPLRQAKDKFLFASGSIWLAACLGKGKNNIIIVTYRIVLAPKKDEAYVIYLMCQALMIHPVVAASLLLAKDAKTQQGNNIMNLKSQGHMWNAWHSPASPSGTYHPQPQFPSSSFSFPQPVHSFLNHLTLFILSFKFLKPAINFA